MRCGVEREHWKETEWCLYVTVSCEGCSHLTACQIPPHHLCRENSIKMAIYRSVACTRRNIHHMESGKFKFLKLNSLFCFKYSFANHHPTYPLPVQTSLPQYYVPIFPPSIAVLFYFMITYHTFLNIMHTPPSKLKIIWIKNNRSGGSFYQDLKQNWICGNIMCNHLFQKEQHCTLYLGKYVTIHFKRCLDLIPVSSILAGSCSSPQSFYDTVPFQLNH